jgi:hypothetical protein
MKLMKKNNYGPIPGPLARMLIYSKSETVTDANREGADMKTDAVVKDAEKNTREIVTCSCCDRVLTNPKESVRSRQRVMCVSCYESLLNPFQKSCCSGAVI